MYPHTNSDNRLFIMILIDNN